MNEVALSVQYASEVIDEVDALSRFRPKVERDYPKLAKQPPLPPATEDFDRPPQPGGFPFQLFQAPPTTRYWFLSDPEDWLVQLQGDRFMLNWRQTSESATYPRYRVIRPKFEQLFREFHEMLDRTPAVVDVSWCEITYTNHVEVRAEGGGHGPLARVLRALNPSVVSQALAPVEDTQLQQRFLISDPDTGVPFGRFYIIAAPGWRVTDGAPIYALTLMARVSGFPERLRSGWGTVEGASLRSADRAGLRV